MKLTVELTPQQAEALLAAAYRGRDEWEADHDAGGYKHPKAGAARLACIKVANVVKAERARKAAK